MEHSTYSTGNVKRRLLREGIKQPKCERCGLTEWNGEPAPLEMDHVNGVNDDHRIENLRLLCANCHAQTETYKGKNTVRARAGRVSQRPGNLP